MPKRTNEFQKVVYLMQKQLADSAIVTESKLIVDPETNKEVEIDIFVEGKLSEVPIRIGIECISEGRPATVEWVREMIGKHSSLPIDKTVLVSKSGFCKQAITKAQANGVEAISLDQAIEADWAEYLKKYENLKFCGFSLNVLSYSVVVDIDGTPINRIKFEPKSDVYDGSNERVGTLAQFIESFIKSRELGEKIMDVWFAKPENERQYDYDRTVSWTPNEVFMITGEESVHFKINKFEIKIHIHIGEADLKLTASQFGGKQFAHGAVPNIFSADENSKEAIILSLQNQNGVLGDGTIMLPKLPDGTEQIFKAKSLLKKE